MDTTGVLLFTALLALGEASSERKGACCQYSVLSLSELSSLKNNGYGSDSRNNGDSNDSNQTANSRGTLLSALTSGNEYNLTRKADGLGIGSIDGMRVNGSDAMDNDLSANSRNGAHKEEIVRKDYKKTNSTYNDLSDSKNKNILLEARGGNKERSKMVAVLVGRDVDIVESKKDNSDEINSKTAAGKDQSSDDNSYEGNRITVAAPQAYGDDVEEPKHGKIIADSNTYGTHHDLEDPALKIVIMTGNPRDQSSKAPPSGFPVTSPPRRKPKSTVETFITAMLLSMALGGCLIVLGLALYPHCKQWRNQMILNQSDSLEESRDEASCKAKKQARNHSNFKTGNTYYVGTDLNDFEDKFVSSIGYRNRNNDNRFDNEQATSMLGFDIDEEYDENDDDNRRNEEDTCSVPFTPVSERAPSPIPITATPTMTPKRNKPKGHRLHKEVTSADSSCAKKLPRTSTHRYSNYNNIHGHLSGASCSSLLKIASTASAPGSKNGSPTSSSWPSWDDSGFGKGAESNSKRQGNLAVHHQYLKDISNVHNYNNNNSNNNDDINDNNMIKNNKILKPIDENEENSDRINNNDNGTRTNKPAVGVSAKNVTANKHEGISSQIENEMESGTILNDNNNRTGRNNDTGRSGGGGGVRDATLDNRLSNRASPRSQWSDMMTLTAGPRRYYEETSTPGKNLDTELSGSIGSSRPCFVYPGCTIIGRAPLVRNDEVSL